MGANCNNKNLRVVRKDNKIVLPQNETQSRYDRFATP